MKFRGRAHSLPSDHWRQRLEWCRHAFGPESHDRWMPKYAYEFRFKYEKDLAFYLLRWE